MTLARVGRRNIRLGLGSLVIGAVILVAAIVPGEPAGLADPRASIGRGAALLWGLWFGGAAIASGVGLVIRGWLQQR
jgi:hypothetical protein